MAELTHLDEHGHARMVDVGDKAPTKRVAVASGFVRTGAAVRDRIADGAIPKGDVLSVARIAGIQAAKRTADLGQSTNGLGGVNRQRPRPQVGEIELGGPA